MDIVMFMLGTAFGTILTWFFLKFALRFHLIGVLRVDHSDPFDGPYMFLEIASKTKLDSIGTKKYVILKVSHENLNSRK